MRLIRHHHRSFATGLCLLAAAAWCPAQTADEMRLQEAISDLHAQNRALQQSLAEANRAEKLATEQLNQIRERLEALGKNLLDGGDDRLVQAAADLQIAHERTAEVESTATRLAATVQDYMRQAVVADPDARIRLETALRELDAALGLRQKPRPDVRTGSLQQARVVSVDQETGMLVLNLGESQGARIGMSFRVLRGQEPYATAILADVRRSVSGAFIESTTSSAAGAPRPGDTAVILTQNER
ncbi:MAG: hypothetical protein ACNA8L_13220 [Luteolibacter sp.]